MVWCQNADLDIGLPFYLTSNENIKSYDNIHSQKKGKMGKKINSPH